MTHKLVATEPIPGGVRCTLEFDWTDAPFLIERKDGARPPDTHRLEHEVIRAAAAVGIDGYYGASRTAVLEEMIEHCENRARDGVPVYVGGDDLARLFRALLAHERALERA